MVLLLPGLLLPLLLRCRVSGGDMRLPGGRLLLDAGRVCRRRALGQRKQVGVPQAAAVLLATGGSWGRIRELPPSAVLLLLLLLLRLLLMLGIGIGRCGRGSGCPPGTSGCLPRRPPRCVPLPRRLNELPVAAL